MERNLDTLRRVDGRLEYVCEHGVGHTIWFPEGSNAVHGCDGCCNSLSKKDINNMLKDNGGVRKLKKFKPLHLPFG